MLIATISTHSPRRELRAMNEAETLRKRLLGLALRPESLVSIALAGVVAQSWSERGFEYLPLFGLDAYATWAVMEDHFPGVSCVIGQPWKTLQQPAAFAEALELEDLLRLLIDHRIVADDSSRWLSHALATACLGADHLWQDMNLPSRRALSDLLYGYFPALAVRNHSDMKWKKFLYLQLCERENIRICKSPSCDCCTDYQVCFGPEV